jgi:hypothetical protein
MARHHYCDVLNIRCWMTKELEKLPPSKNKKETPEEFWSRVEEAGLLIEAIQIYDQIATEYEEYRHTRRETKKQFEERLEREGRQAEAERVRAELLASGLRRREIQVKLIERLQPLDGSKTRAWETPDPWDSGRLFRNKQDQERLFEEAYPPEEEDEQREVVEARDRIEWAERRRDERQALREARQRAQALKVEQMQLPSKQAAKPKPAAEGQPRKAASSANGAQDRVVI